MNFWLRPCLKSHTRSIKAGISCPLMITGVCVCVCVWLIDRRESHDSGAACLDAGGRRLAAHGWDPAGTERLPRRHAADPRRQLPFFTVHICVSVSARRRRRAGILGSGPPASTCGNHVDPATLSGWQLQGSCGNHDPLNFGPPDKNSWRHPCTYLSVTVTLCWISHLKYKRWRSS